MQEIIENPFYDISITLANDFIASHSLSQSPQISRAIDYGYYVAYKPITCLSILFMFVEMKFIHCHSCVMFAMKSMSTCND